MKQAEDLTLAQVRFTLARLERDDSPNIPGRVPRPNQQWACRFACQSLMRLAGLARTGTAPILRDARNARLCSGKKAQGHLTKDSQKDCTIRPDPGLVKSPMRAFLTDGQGGLPASVKILNSI